MKDDLSAGEARIKALILPLQQGQFSAELGKVLVYVQSVTRNLDSWQNALSFARRNLDSARLQALEALVHRPRLASKADLEKKALALQKSFDRMDDPARAMLEHYSSSSDPLNKYLVAGPWGHEYLQKRRIDSGEYDLALCQILGCQETKAGRMVLSYAPLCRAIDELETMARDALE